MKTIKERTEKYLIPVILISLFLGFPALFLYTLSNSFISFAVIPIICILFIAMSEYMEILYRDFNYRLQNFLPSNPEIWKIPPSDCILYYDGPLAFISKNKAGRLFLIWNWDDEDSGDPSSDSKWLLKPITPKNHYKFIKGMISLRQLFSLTDSMPAYVATLNTDRSADNFMWDSIERFTAYDFMQLPDFKMDSDI